MTHVEKLATEYAPVVVSEEASQVTSRISNPAEEPPLGNSRGVETHATMPEAEDLAITEPSEEESIPLTQFRLFGDALLEIARNTAQESVQSFDELRAEVHVFHERAAGYEENVRLMHSRIEKLQQDQVRVLLKPVFERLAGLHAQANDIAEQKREADASTAGDFSFFAESIEELFSLYDLDSVGAAAGAPFDTRQHTAARIVKTDRPDLDGTLQRVIRQGFRFASSERVFMPARVTVCRYAAPAEVPATAASGQPAPRELDFPASAN